MTVRQLSLNDEPTLTAILHVQRAAYRIEANRIGFDRIPPLIETKDELRSSAETFYGCFVNDALAGIIAIEYEDQVLVIARLAVHPDYFRRGIARQLLAHVETRAQPDQVIHVSTGMLNAPARTFYEQHGFTRIEDREVVEGLWITEYEKQIIKKE